jgi:phosphatidylserine/phosphatidylglycerophosphate/cardiolipin synthase-like enzyme
MEIRWKKYRVNRELWREYKYSSYVEEYNKTVFSNEKKKALFDWIEKWKNIKNLEFPTEAKHFFLDGRHLDELSKELITKAENEVLVVNPFVNKCALSDTLKEASNQGVNVHLLTRPPDDKTLEYRRAKEEYHLTLKKAGVNVRYNKAVHAKIIVVDRTVAISSSMNFYCGSSGGKSWEAGIVTQEQTVVEPIVSKILKILEKHETKEMKKEANTIVFDNIKEISTF